MSKTEIALGNVGFSRRQFVMGAGAAIATGCALSVAGIALADDAKDADASAGDAQTQTVTDMGGTEVEVPLDITKYADGWFAHNEISIMLNGANGMVATHCTKDAYPWMYYVCPAMDNALSTFGTDFNFEELVDLGPQVVFDSSDNLRDKLTEVGIPLLNMMFTDYDGMKQSITLTAQVFGGDAPDIAEKYNAELDQTLSDIKAVTDQIADEDRPTVLHGNAVYSYICDGSNNIIEAWIDAAGGKDVNPDTTDNATTTYSLEQIIEWNPDYIITGTPDDVDKILGDESWSSITAVQNGNVFVNPKGVFGWDRYGVEELLQLYWASHLLHPDLFADVDINQKVKDFYKTYLNFDLTDDDVDQILAAQPPVTDKGDDASTDSTTDSSTDATAGSADAKTDDAGTDDASKGDADTDAKTDDAGTDDAGTDSTADSSTDDTKSAA